MKNLRKRAVLIAIACCLFASSNCLLTNELGIEPIDSVSGASAKAAIEEAGMMSWFFADMLIDSKYKDIKEDNFFAQYLWSLIHGILLQSQASIQDDRYYTITSVKDCVDYIHISGALIYKFVRERRLNHILNKGRSDSVGFFGGILYAGPIIIMDECKLEETGKIIHLGDKTNL